MIEVENPMTIDSLWNDQEKFIGYDATGQKVFAGDSIVEIDGEIILEENLEDYLIKYFDARFTYAK